MPNFDLDGEVQNRFGGLVDRMRARRLQGELPKPPADEKLNDEADASGGGEDDQAALESMLGDYDAPQDDPAKKA